MESAGVKAVVHAIEDVLLIALVVEHGELRRIEKPSGIQPVGFNEVTPVLAAIGEVETGCRGCRSCRTKCDAAGGLVTPWPERVVAQSPGWSCRRTRPAGRRR